MDHRHKLLNTHEHTVGNWCIFVPIDQASGVKLYYSAKLRNASMRGQQFAAEHNVGPSVEGKIDLDIDETKCFMQGKLKPHKYKTEPTELYGYITELADTKHHKKLHWLELKLQEIGFNTIDLHKNNTGVLSDGTLVCLDFDAVSTCNHILQNDINETPDPLS